MDRYVTLDFENLKEGKEKYTLMKKLKIAFRTSVRIPGGSRQTVIEILENFQVD